MEYNPDLDELKIQDYIKTINKYEKDNQKMTRDQIIDYVKNDTYQFILNLLQTENNKLDIFEKEHIYNNIAAKLANRVADRYLSFPSSSGSRGGKKSKKKRIKRRSKTNRRRKNKTK